MTNERKKYEVPLNVEDINILPCPFCGHSPEWRHNTINSGWGLCCGRVYKDCPCGPCTLDFPNALDTIKKWNTRYVPITNFFEPVEYPNINFKVKQAAKEFSEKTSAIY